MFGVLLLLSFCLGFGIALAFRDEIIDWCKHLLDIKTTEEKEDD